MTLAQTIEKMLTEKYSTALDRRGITAARGMPVPMSKLSGGMSGLNFATQLFATGGANALNSKLVAKARDAAATIPDLQSSIPILEKQAAYLSRFPHYAPSRRRMIAKIATAKARLAKAKSEAVAPVATKAELMRLAAPALRSMAQNMASATKLQISAWKEGKAGPELWNKMLSSGVMLPSKKTQALATLAKRMPTEDGRPINVDATVLHVAEGLDGFREAGAFAGDIDNAASGFGADIEDGSDGFGADDIDDAAANFGRTDNFGVDVRDIANAASGFGADIDSGSTGFGEDIESGADSFGQKIGLACLGKSGFGADLDEGATGFGADIEEGAVGFGEDIDTGADSFGQKLGLLGLGASPGEDDLDAGRDEETDAFLPEYDTWTFKELKMADQPAATSATLSVAKNGIKKALQVIQSGGTIVEVKYALGKLGIVPPGMFSAPKKAGEKAYLEILRALSQKGFIGLTGKIKKAPKLASGYQPMRFGLNRMVG